jgi:hypothetical protein
MTYKLGDTLIDNAGISSVDEFLANVTQDVSARISVRGVFVSASVQRGATMFLELFVDDERVLSASSGNPGYSFESSTIWAFKVGKTYRIRAVQKNSNATAESTSVFAVIVII